jgi:hypothetical protein
VPFLFTEFGCNLGAFKTKCPWLGMTRHDSAPGWPHRSSSHMGVGQNLLLSCSNGMNIHNFQLFWGSPGVPGFCPIAI